MSAVRPWVSLLRFEEYGPPFLLCGVAGALFAGLGSPVPLVGLLCFIGTFSASAFVLNDIADWKDDSSGPSPRNPIARGALSRSSAAALFLVLAAVSLGSLALVGPPALYAAPFVYALYWGYSWGPQFKARAGVDVVVHGAVPGLFVFMGGALSGSLTAGTALLSGVVFCMAAMSGVLQGVRDMGKDAGSRRTTALALGQGRSADLALLLVGSGVALYVAAVAGGYLPPGMAVLLPGAWFLISPLLRLRAGDEGAGEVIRMMRFRGLLLALGAVALYVLWARPG